MKLSEAIIEAMNDIDESLLEGSEVIERESIFSKKGWLILTSVFVALLVLLPLASNMFRMGSTNEDAPSEAATTEAAPEAVEEVGYEEAKEAIDESIQIHDGNVLVSMTPALYEALGTSDTYEVICVITDSEGNYLSEEVLKDYAKKYEETYGYKVISITEEGIIFELSEEEIMNFNLIERYNYLLDLNK